MTNEITDKAGSPGSTAKQSTGSAAKAQAGRAPSVTEFGPTESDYEEPSPRKRDVRKEQSVTIEKRSPLATVISGLSEQESQSFEDGVGFFAPASSSEPTTARII